MGQAAQGYGSADEMMGQGPMDAELAGQAPPAEEGQPAGDIEAMLAEGVQAFMESQDPQIAVQVVMMLAETMGITGGQGGGENPSSPQPAPNAQQGVPMAKNGGKFGWFGNEGIASDFQKFVTQK